MTVPKHRRRLSEPESLDCFNNTFTTPMSHIRRRSSIRVPSYRLLLFALMTIFTASLRSYAPFCSLVYNTLGSFLFILSDPTYHQSYYSALVLSTCTLSHLNTVQAFVSTSHSRRIIPSFITLQSSSYTKPRNPVNTFQQDPTPIYSPAASSFTASSTRPVKSSYSSSSSPPSRSVLLQAARSNPNLLSKQEEVSLTHSIRLLRHVIRIRDRLAVMITTTTPPPMTTIEPHNHSSSLTLHSTSTSSNNNPMDFPTTLLPYTPTEAEWAQACNVTIPHLRRILIQGRDARSKLVSANIGLVMQIAKRYSYQLHLALGGGEFTRGGGGSGNSEGISNPSSSSNNGGSSSSSPSSSSSSSTTGMGTILTLQDMIQEGNLGLMEAAERFDPSRGFRFSTYAAYWVRQRILRCIADNSRIIRLPAHVHSILRNIRKTKNQMEKEIGRPPSLPELAHYLEMPLDKLRLYTDSSRTVLSLEVPLNRSAKTLTKSTLDEDKRTLGEKIACTEEPTPEEDATYDALRSDIRSAIDGLGNDRERDVLIARFGLEDGTPRTLEETAKRLGLSRDRVRMVEARALNKLRHPQRNYKLKLYVNGGVGGGASSGQSTYPGNNGGNPSMDNMSHFTSTVDGLSSSTSSSNSIEHWDRSPRTSLSSSSMLNQGTIRQGRSMKSSQIDEEHDTLSRFSPEKIWSV